MEEVIGTAIVLIVLLPLVIARMIRGKPPGNPEHRVW